MGKTISKFNVPKSHRNPLAVVARARRSGTMHDRRADRGGARNEQAEYMEDYLADLDEVG